MNQWEQEIVDAVPAEGGISLGDLLDALSERAKQILLKTKRKGLVTFINRADEETRVYRGSSV